MDLNSEEHPHMRLNPLTGEWVLVSPHRTLRPWAGRQEPVQEDEIPEFDPENPLCPGVRRPSGQVTDRYESTYVFPNDYPALLENGRPSATEETDDDPLFRTKSVKGTCRVMCFHPKSNVLLATLPLEDVVHIIDRWVQETEELGQKYEWVQIFENKGAIMGCSNPHPHCQIWASDFLPDQARIKDEKMRAYLEKHKVPLLCDYVRKELKRKKRIVCENSNWVVVVPFWAVWPYETMVLPKRQLLRFTDLSRSERRDLADIVQALLVKYDNLFECSFPYSMGWHGAPTGKYLADNADHWTFHGLYYPPLLRSAAVKKFMVGYEMLAQAQRDLTAEKAAEILRNQSDRHYTLKI